ncbi:hypothetical protein [Kingella sp. (in: b-proteobacteria)]|nr:hypothetical protein [Kingella sp. (in: b-proteobacteria)]MDO4657765.1 hypothetical protein [Kingella sp. (in: b-proteobacteria)]
MERQWLADILTTQQMPFVAIWWRAAAAPFWVSGCLWAVQGFRQTACFG